MARNFDEELEQRVWDDRTFTVRGRALEVKRTVRPELVAGFNDMNRRLAAGEALSDEQVIGTLDETIRALLVDPGVWDEVRANGDPDVDSREMWAVLTHCIAVVGGRPTTPSSEPGDGPSDGGTPSTPAFSSPADEVPALST